MQIYTPQQYFAVVRGARKSKTPYAVHEIVQEDIYNFKDLCKLLKNKQKDENGNIIKWRQICQLAVRKDDPRHVFFTYYHGDHFLKFDLFRRCRGKILNLGKHPIQRLYNCRLHIAKAKYDDLAALCSARAIPTVYHAFYLHLPCNFSTNDDYGDECRCSDRE